MKSPKRQIIQPRVIRLEASTVCQLRCPACPTASGEVGKTLGSGFLKFRDFKKIVDDNPWVSHIGLSNWGEIFLNKELIKILRYAYKHNVTLDAGNGANLNTVSKEVLAALVRYRFHEIKCSIDGTNQETYSQYRRNGNFKNVIENIRTINKFKRAYRSPYPMLTWQFVVFGHNEHEISLARKMAKELDMEFHVKLSWGDLYTEPFSPVKDKELIRKETGLGVATRGEYREKYGKEYSLNECCFHLWTSPQINYDGQLLGCCINYWDTYGNVFKDGLLACLNNEKMNAVREMLMGRRPIAEGMPCERCKSYKSRKENNYWVTDKDIEQREYIKSRLYIMLENKILGPRLAQKLANFVYRIRQRLQNRVLQLRALSGESRVASGVYPLQVPLPLDKGKGWQPFPIFKGATAGLQEFSCHASVLIPGHCPHPPHAHEEEEIVLFLSGEADLTLPDTTDQQGNDRRHIKAGEFVYYPRNFSHTLETTGGAAANYLMFKWQTGRQNKKAGLAFGSFEMLPSRADPSIANDFYKGDIFAGPTIYLSELACHFSILTPHAGYAPHADDYDVAIVVLEGQVETLGQRVSPFGVIFYAAGEPHGMFNPGEGAAKYIVFEFHAFKTPFLHRMRQRDQKLLTEMSEERK